MDLHKVLGDQLREMCVFAMARLVDDLRMLLFVPVGRGLPDRLQLLGLWPVGPLTWLGALKRPYEFCKEPGQLLLLPDVMDAGLWRVP